MTNRWLRVGVCAGVAMLAAAPGLKTRGSSDWSQKPPLSSGFDPATFDKSVRPQDDLYRYVNGRWLDTTAIPDDRVSYSAPAELAEKTLLDLRAVIEAVASSTHRRSSTEEQVADLYASMLDEKTIEARGISPLEPELRAIDAVESIRTLAERAGKLSATTTSGPFFASVGLDPKDSNNRLVELSQGGILLDRDNYLNQDARPREIRAEYEKYLTRIFTITKRQNPAADAAAVLQLEIELARAQATAPVPPAPAMTLTQMNDAMPGFDWPAWAKPQGIDRVAGVVVKQPDFFRTFAALVPARPLSTWRAWLAARYITALSPYVNRETSDARFDFFGTFLTGQRVVIPRWKRAVGLVNSMLGDTVGRLYVEKHFTRTSRTRVERMVENVVRAYRQAVTESEWMSGSAKGEAQTKLALLATRVGYPDVWKSYRGLEILPNDLFGNMARGAAFENQRRMNRVLRPDDRGEWLSTPQLVNAYYVPAQNEIVLPAAMLQPPYFDAEADDAVNYGAIGAVIGHEIGHALDDTGRWYDGRGKVYAWWKPQDEEGFRVRAQLVLNQLDGNPPVDGLRLNGLMVLNETMGDLAGLSMAYRAYQIARGDRPAPLDPARGAVSGSRTALVIDGLTGDQRFFLGWARIWRTKERPEYRRQLFLTSRYAPVQHRANRTAGNIEGFYQAFGVVSGDALYIAPGQRVRIY